MEEAADHPVASMGHVQQWEWPIQRFRTRQYGEEYQSVNLDQFSLHDPYVQGVEQGFDHLHRLFEPGGCAQLHL